MSSFEYEQAKLDLENAKDDIYQYLIESYYSDKSIDEKEDVAKETFKYLENILNGIFKRHPLKLSFGKGGSPVWYSRLFTKLALWIETEHKVTEIMAEELNNILD